MLKVVAKILTACLLLAVWIQILAFLVWLGEEVGQLILKLPFVGDDNVFLLKMILSLVIGVCFLTTFPFLVSIYTWIFHGFLFVSMPSDTESYSNMFRSDDDDYTSRRGLPAASSREDLRNSGGYHQQRPSRQVTRVTTVIERRIVFILRDGNGSLEYTVDNARSDDAAVQIVLQHLGEQINNYDVERVEVHHSEKQVKETYLVDDDRNSFFY